MCGWFRLRQQAGFDSELLQQRRVAHDLRTGQHLDRDRNVQTNVQSTEDLTRSTAANLLGQQTVAEEATHAHGLT